MTKTGVVHPSDPSTDFLSAIYKGKGFDKITAEGGRRYDVIDSIASGGYERIIMLGHGLPQGLLAGYSLIVNKETVSVLRKTSNIYIWCNADVFVRKHRLRGFYTGMFISDMMEANIFSIPASKEQITFSNNHFSVAVRRSLHLEPTAMRDSVMDLYYTDNNPVIHYNIQQMEEVEE